MDKGQEEEVGRGRRRGEMGGWRREMGGLGDGELEGWRKGQQWRRSE